LGKGQALDEGAIARVGVKEVEGRIGLDIKKQKWIAFAGGLIEQGEGFIVFTEQSAGRHHAHGHIHVGRSEHRGSERDDLQRDIHLQKV